MKRRHSFTVWEGASELDGKPIALLVTRAGSKSNRKTGALIQTYILRTDKSPVEVLQRGEDGSICGKCIHSSKGNGGLGSCYVRIDTGALNVFKAYQRGKYPLLTPQESREEAKGSKVRLGTYGDPSAVPQAIWEDFLAEVGGVTGYTHAWKQERFQGLKQWCMASCDTVAEDAEARAMAWRTFTVLPKGSSDTVPGSFLCPASEEGGKKLTCIECMACDGLKTGRKASVFIHVHGVAFKQARFNNLITIGRV